MIFIGLGLVIGINLVGCGKQAAQPVLNSPSSPVTPESSEEIPTVGQDVMNQWKTYRDEKLGIEIQYPAGLKIGSEEDLATGNIVITKSKAAGSQEQVLLFEIPQTNTNLQKAYIRGEFLTMSKKECFGQIEARKIFSDKPNSIVQLKVDDVAAYRVDSTDAGLGNRYRTISYIAPFNNGCYIASLVLHSTERMNYDEKDRPSEYDPAFYIDTFEKMIARVRFIKV